MGVAPTSGFSWNDPVVDTSPTIKTINGITYQYDPATGTWPPAQGLPYDAPSGGGAPAAKAQTLTTINGKYYWVDPYTQSLTPAGIDVAPQEQPFGGYITTKMGGKTYVWDPMTGTVGATYDDPVAPTEAPRDDFLTGSSAGAWIQKIDGSIVWQPTPLAGGGQLSAATAPSSSAPRAATSAGVSTPVDPYKSQQMAIQAQEKAAAAQRAWQGGQNTIDRQLSAYQDAAGQRFSGGESMLDRNFQGGWNQYQAGANNAGIDLQRRQFGLNAANTAANLVSTPDLAALPAFLMAGGGSAINAAAGGATALTSNAVAPAALAAYQNAQPWAPLPTYSYTPEANPYLPAPVPMPNLAPVAPVASAARGDGGGEGRRTAWNRTPKMAEGGYTTAPEFMVGDRKDGRPTGTEEIVRNPTGAPLQVMPNRGQLGIPRYATGTYTTSVGGLVGGSGDPYVAPQTSSIALPTGYVAVDASLIPADYLPKDGKTYTYAHNPTTGQVVRIDSQTGLQYEMYNTITPPGAAYDPNVYGSLSMSSGPRVPHVRPAAPLPPPSTIETPAGSVDTVGGAPTPTPTTPTGVGAPTSPTGGAVTPPAVISAEQGEAPRTYDQVAADLMKFRSEYQSPVKWNPYAANYWEQDPNLRDIAELGVQTKLGIPVSTSQNQAAKLRIPGLNRGNLALGV